MQLPKVTSRIIKINPAPQLSIQRNGNSATLSKYLLQLFCFVKAMLEAGKRRTDTGLR